LCQRRLVRVDIDLAVHGMHSIGSQRNHAWWSGYFAGTNIERTIVKIAFDDIAVDKAFGQGAGAVSSEIVGHVKLVFNVKHGKRQAVFSTLVAQPAATSAHVHSSISFKYFVSVMVLVLVTRD
jgi:hypothetical protein